jgi:hypothetical protein
VTQAQHSDILRLLWCALVVDGRCQRNWGTPQQVLGSNVWAWME